jgi:hypothetical protein
MSNLSELLPTGGGQNAVNFVASGTLSSGQTVALKSDGTVEAVAETSSTTSKGTESTFDSSAVNSFVRTTYDTVNNKIVAIWRTDTVGDYGYAAVGTVSGTSISWGTRVVFNSRAVSTSGQNITSVYDSINDRVFIASSTVNAIYCISGAVSGTSISFGPEALITDAVTPAAKDMGSAFNPNQDADGRILVAFRDDKSTGDPGRCFLCRLNSSTGAVEFLGNPNRTFTSNQPGYVTCVYDDASNAFVITYRDYGNSSYGTSVIVTYTTFEPSFSSGIVWESAAVNYPASTFDSTSKKVVIAYAYGASPFDIRARVGEVSGASISFGSAVVINPDQAYFYVTVSYNSQEDKVIAGFGDTGSSNTGRAVPLQVSGLSLSVGSETTFAGGSSNYVSQAYDSGSNRTVFTYRDSSGYVRVYETSYLLSNNTDFIGITAGAISDTATGAVNVYGGINEAQTGLTIGSDYYVQDNGSLSTTASSVKVGQAISATTINMMDLT